MERITVNMSPTAMLETCHASQFDVGVQKRFDLVDGSSAYTLTGAETITLKIRTPDGTLVESNVPNTSDSYVIWTSSEGELDEFGICLCSIHVTNGSDELGSGNFIMEVEADPYDGKNLRIVTVGPSDICTFETDLAEPLVSVKSAIIATGGYSDGTPHAINGYTGLNLTACGVNLLDTSTFVNLAIDNVGNTYYAANRLLCPVFKVKHGVTYMVDIPTGMRFLSLCEYSNTSTFYQRVEYNTTTSTTITPTTDFIRLYVSKADTSANVSPSDASNFQLEVGSTEHAYHAYTGTVYPVSWQDEAGTVYGGERDLTTGVLTVTHGELTLGTGFAKDGSNRYYKRLGADFNAKAYSGNEVANAICECYNAISPNNYNGRSLTGVTIATSLSQPTIMIYDANYDDTAANFDALVKDYKLAYELATPVTYNLTPVQVRAIVGQNNVFADTGDTEVKYLTEG